MHLYGREAAVKCKVYAATRYPLRKDQVQA